MRESNFLIIRFLYGCDPSRLRGSDVEEVESPEAGRGVPRDASGLNAARHTGGSAGYLTRGVLDIESSIPLVARLVTMGSRHNACDFSLECATHCRGELSFENQICGGSIRFRFLV